MTATLSSTISVPLSSPSSVTSPPTFISTSSTGEIPSILERIPNSLLRVVFSFFECKEAAIWRRVSKRVTSSDGEREAIPYVIHLSDDQADYTHPVRDLWVTTSEDGTELLVSLPPPALLLRWCERVACLHVYNVCIWERMMKTKTRFSRVRILKCCIRGLQFDLFPCLTELHLETMSTYDDLRSIPVSVTHLSLQGIEDAHAIQAYPFLSRLSLHSFTLRHCSEPEVLFSLLHHWAPSLLVLDLQLMPRPPPGIYYPSSGPLRHLSVGCAEGIECLTYFREVSTIQNLLISLHDGFAEELLKLACMSSILSLDFEIVSTTLVGNLFRVYCPPQIRSLRIAYIPSELYVNDSVMASLREMTQLCPPLTRFILHCPCAPSSEKDIRDLFSTVPELELHLDVIYD